MLHSAPANRDSHVFEPTVAGPTERRGTDSRVNICAW